MGTSKEAAAAKGREEGRENGNSERREQLEQQRKK